MILALVLAGPMLMSIVLIFRRNYSVQRAPIIYGFYFILFFLFTYFELIGLGLAEHWRSSFFAARTFLWLLAVLFAAWLVGPFILRKHITDRPAGTTVTKNQ